jgi:hypothetical protein
MNRPDCWVPAAEHGENQIHQGRNSTNMNSEMVLREQLRLLLKGHNAHLSIEQAIEDFPLAKINARLPNVDYTPWQLLEHMRIAQWDILQFINDPNHVSPGWPDGYWPQRDVEADEETWKSTVDNLLSGLDSVEALLMNGDIDLYSPLSHAPKYTILREILLIADHNAYHLGQLMLLKKCLT